MSRYRGGREDDYDGGRVREREFEERGERGRDERYGERAPDPRESRDDFYRDRDYFRGRDFDTGAVGGAGERADYERARRHEDDRRYEDERRRDDYYDEGRRAAQPAEREGRPLWEGGGGRDYPPRRAEGRSSGGGGRGRATRSHLRCRDIMTRDVTVATRDTTLEEVARMMRDEDTGVIPVVDRNSAPPPQSTASAEGLAAATAATPTHDAPDVPDGRGPGARRGNAGAQGNGRLVGLITDRDVVVRAVAEGRDARTVRAEEIMTADVHTAQPNDRVIDAIRKMGDKQVRRVPVVDREGVLRGIISMADVALETDDDRELAEALEEISSGSSFWSKIFG